MFLILSQEDHPLYERRFPLKKTTLGNQQVLNAQFILHAALDVFDEKYKSSKELFLKEIDQKQDYRVYGYVTPSNIRFLVLTDQDEERVKIFCQLAHEQLIKILMNPLYQLGTQITSSSFESVQELIVKNNNINNKNQKILNNYYNLIIVVEQIIVLQHNNQTVNQ